MLIVQVCHFDNNGDAHYRLHEPSRHLARLPGVTAVDCHFAHRYLPDLAERADVLVLQFVNDWDLVSLIAPRRARGQITIFEANDYFFDLQSWSPIAARWQDRTVQELYSQLLMLADGVQTSTEALAEHWRERGAKHVAVFSNHLSEIAPLPPIADRPLTIGWAGSPGHFADWYQVVPLLQRWLDAHPAVHLAVMTNELAHSFFQLPPERYHFTPFGPLTEYLRFLRSVDIGLAPLLPTAYNRGRSDVKFLEYASQGVAGIYADLEPYRESVVPQETGLLYRTPAELIECLNRLHGDPALRHKLRRQAYDYVRGQRLLSGHIDERLQWYRGLLDKAVGNRPLPDEIERAAKREGNYLRLLPQEPELAFQDALKQPPRDAAAILERLLRQHPNYLAARQHWGRLLNDLGDPRALNELTTLRDIAPNRGQAWSEFGRAWFRRNDFERAREALENGIRVDPNYLPAWQYLLRMLNLTRHPDGPRWARDGVERFPACYPLALLGVQALPREQVAAALMGLLDRYQASFTDDEKPLAMAAFRDAILAAIRAAPSAVGNGPLLRRACEVFPESAKLAELLGEAFIAGGETDEGRRHQIRALSLRRQADLVRSEYPPDDAPPYLAMFAEHIRRHQDSEIGSSPARLSPLSPRYSGGRGSG